VDGSMPGVTQSLVPRGVVVPADTDWRTIS